MPVPAYHPFMRALAAGLRRCGVAEGEHWLLAVSGGGDSTALLHAAAQLAGRRSWRLRLTVGHVQHGVRAAADVDADFVAAAAARLGLPFLRRDLPASARRGGNLEERLRQGRYAALGAMACEAGALGVVSAHHADDQLETMLLRLARGSGPEGLCAMPWRRPLDEGAPPLALLRPLLGATRAQAQDFLRRIGEPWRHDESNDDPTRARARLRQRVLPELEALHPGAALRAAATAEALRDRLEAAPPSSAPLSRAEARTLAPHLLRRRIAAWLRASGGPDIPPALLSQVSVASSDGSGRRRSFDLPGGGRLVVGAQMLEWQR